MLAFILLALSGLAPMAARPMAAPALATPTPMPATNCNAIPPTTDMVNPPELRSKNGVLAVTLRLAGSNDPANLTGLCWFWNENGYKSWIPPTLRLKQGEQLQLTLLNELVLPPGANAAPQEQLGGWGDAKGKDPYKLMCGQPQLTPTPTPDPVTGRIYGYHRTPWNETNMHFHGLNVSPQNPSDDVVHILLCPRSSYADPPHKITYTIDIPRDAPPGLYWYHPHAHGESERQVISQLSGAIIVDPVVFTPPQGMPNRIIMVRDLGAPGSIPPMTDPRLRATRARNPSLAQIRADFKKNGPPNPDIPPWRFGPPQACPGSSGPTHDIPHANTKTLLVNGIPLPIFPNHKPLLPRGTMTAGRTEYWRLANTVADTILDIELWVNGQRAPINVVERDGIPLVVSNGHPTWQAVPMQHVQLSPAGRLEFYVTAPASGDIVLRTKAIDSGCLGDLAFERDLLLMKVKPAPGAAPVQQVRTPNAVDPVKMKYSDLAQQRPAKHRYFAFTEYNRDDEPIPDWYITELSNPKAIEHPYTDHAKPDVTVHSGTVEDWTILNYTQELHEFHMHQIHFLVTKDREGPEYGFNQLLDMVEVKYGQYRGSTFVPGQVTLRMDFRDPKIVGEFVYHCHILSHEDNGMMAKIRVLPPKGSAFTTARIERPRLPDVPQMQPGELADMHGLVDQNGLPFPGPDAKGKVLMSSFIFTRCPEGLACPLTAGKFAYLQSHIDPAREHLVLFSLDPKNDSPEVLRRYGDLLGADYKRLSFVTGNEQTLRTLAARLGEPRDGNLKQPDALAVLDADGRLRSIAHDDWLPDTALASAQPVLDSPHGNWFLSWLAIGRAPLALPLMLFAW
jgi:FtsP/CotA-like multicopper oxidase with cupredoxin domain/cytochrome oxidase Cu insertion factor (SCO1/SenC/PrrC family)